MARCVVLNKCVKHVSCVRCKHENKFSKMLRSYCGYVLCFKTLLQLRRYVGLTSGMSRIHWIPRSTVEEKHVRTMAPRDWSPRAACVSSAWRSSGPPHHAASQAVPNVWRSVSALHKATNTRRANRIRRVVYRDARVG